MSTASQRCNPIFNDNKLKIGTFATNTIGQVHTAAPDAYKPSWENALRLAKMADRAGSKEDVAAYKQLARDRFGREISIWMLLPIVQRRARGEAEDFLNYYAVEHEDRAAVDGWSSGITSEVRSLNNEAVRLSHLTITAGGAPIMGSATDVADGLEALHEKGVDGILTFWFDFDDGMARFGEGVMPLLEARGLREPFTPPMVQPDWDWPYRTGLRSRNRSGFGDRAFQKPLCNALRKRNQHQDT